MAEQNEEPLGKMIDRLDGLREQIRDLEDKVKPVKAAYTELESEIRQRLSNEGMDKASGKKATVSLKISVVPNIADWDIFQNYVLKTGHLYLLNRAVNAPAFRELYDSEVLSKAPANDPKLDKLKDKFVKKVGLTPFTKVTLNHASLR